MSDNMSGTLRINPNSNIYKATLVETSSSQKQPTAFFGEAKSLSEAAQKVDSLLNMKEELRSMRLVTLQLVAKKEF